MVSPLARLTIVLDLIRWQHTVFALPMALASAVLAIDASPPRSAGWWTWKILLIVLAAFAARSAAMAHNRWADRDIDATNPRTASRPSVTGAVSPGFLLGFTVAACLVFVLISGLINTLALALSPLFLTVLLGYSHAKRFTALAHIWLGVALGLAPGLGSCGCLGGDHRLAGLDATADGAGRRPVGGWFRHSVCAG